MNSGSLRRFGNVFVTATRNRSSFFKRSVTNNVFAENVCLGSSPGVARCTRVNGLYAIKRNFATQTSEINKNSKHELTCGNSITALHDGKDCFPALYEAIDNAKHEILLEMYWLASDAAGWSIASRLIEASKRGVNVRVIYDSFGSIETKQDLFKELEDAGCCVREFNPLPISLFRRTNRIPKIGTMFRRDHRKLLVVDRHVAFTGGVNFAKHWLPKDLDGDGWRDVMVRIEGPSAEAFANVFDRMFSLLQEVHDDHELMMYAKAMRQSARAKILRGKNRFNATKLSIMRWSENIQSNDLKLVPFVEDMIHAGQRQYYENQNAYYKSNAVYEDVGIKGVKRYVNSPTSYAWWAAQGRLTRFFSITQNKNERVETMPQVISKSDIHLEFPRNTVHDANNNSPLGKINERYRLSNVQVMTNDAWNDRRMIRRGYLMAINAAKENIKIVNSYFLPDRSIRKALYRAVRRGVRVQVVVPGETDVLPYSYFTRARYEVMLRRGIEIYEWKPSILHAKVGVFDDDVAVVGTYNFDPLSFRNNLEIVAIIHDKDFSTTLGRRIQADMDYDCKQIDHWDVKEQNSRLKDRFIIMCQNIVFRTMNMLTS